MLSIRLSRKGKKKSPTYRLIVCDKRKDPWGNYLELLGFYNPHTKKIELKAERVKYWLEKGAQPSPTVHNLLITHKLIGGEKIKASKKKAKKTEERDKFAEETKEKTQEETAKTEDMPPKEKKEKKEPEKEKEKPKEDKKAEMQPALKTDTLKEQETKDKPEEKPGEPEKK